jgi:hypothetical protein
MHACVYNMRHINHNVRLLFLADDGGVLGAHTNGKNQEISSFEEVPENN